jgi:hypothetical protein
MSGRQEHNDGKTSFAGQVEIDFSFVVQGTGPVSLVPGINTLRGAEAILPGGSITFLSTGAFTVTLSLGRTYKYLVSKMADVEGTGAGTDGAYAEISSVTGEGTNGQISFIVSLYAAGGASTNLTNRRVSVCLSAKNSASTP